MGDCENFARTSHNVVKLIGYGFDGQNFIIHVDLKVQKFLVSDAKVINLNTFPISTNKSNFALLNIERSIIKSNKGLYYNENLCDHYNRFTVCEPSNILTKYELAVLGEPSFTKVSIKDNCFIKDTPKYIVLSSRTIVNIKAIRQGNVTNFEKPAGLHIFRKDLETNYLVTCGKKKAIYYYTEQNKSTYNIRFDNFINNVTQTKKAHIEPLSDDFSNTDFFYRDLVW